MYGFGPLKCESQLLFTGPVARLGKVWHGVPPSSPLLLTCVCEGEPPAAGVTLFARLGQLKLDEISCEPPLMVTSAEQVCGPVPSGGWTPGESETMNCHWVPGVEIEAFGQRLTLKNPLALAVKGFGFCTWLAPAQIAGPVGAGTNCTTIVALV